MSESCPVSREECPNIEMNDEACPCKATDCPRHGYCCQCIAKHRKAGAPVACMAGL